MKRLLILITILSLPASIGFAHIEETWSQCDDRYGKPGGGGDKYSATYKRDGITIRITFNDVRDTSRDESDAGAANRGLPRRGRPVTGKAVEVNYTKEAANSYFSESEAKALLDANAGTAGRSPNGGTWDVIKRRQSHVDYLRFDNKAKARVYWEYIEDANVAKKVRVKLVDQSTEKREQKSGDKLDTIEKDF